jgi:major intracellular serine protease
MPKLPSFTVESLHAEASEYIPDGINMIHAPEQWAKGNEGEGMVIAIIDTGVDYNHPDLKDNILGGKDFTGKGDYMDGNGHGTHVAGTICATNSGSGIVGVAPKAKILALKALDDEGSGSNDWITQAIKYAIQQKVNVISMSLGGESDYSPMHKAIKEARNAGIIVVCAAGNEGDGNTDTEEYSYPGAYHEVFEVGAVDFNKNLAPFSNTNHEVDILAPGVQILSTYPGGGYAKLSGTSMATPHVSGAVALIKSDNIENYKNGDHCLDVTPKQVTPVPVVPTHKHKETLLERLLKALLKLRALGGK